MIGNGRISLSLLRNSNLRLWTMKLQMPNCYTNARTSTYTNKITPIASVSMSDWWKYSYTVNYHTSLNMWNAWFKIINVRCKIGPMDFLG